MRILIRYKFVLFLIFIFFTPINLLFSDDEPKLLRKGAPLPQKEIKKIEKLPQYVLNEVLVRFKKGVNSQRALSIHKTFGATKATEELPNLYKVQIPTYMSVDQAIQLYLQNSDVERVQPNYIYEWFGFTLPNDIHFEKLWGLYNSGQSIKKTIGTVDSDIDGPEAWDITKGEQNSIIVGVLDSGVLLAHNDLIDNILSNGYDFGDNDNDPNDTNQHGTHVAGTIGAVMNNLIGVTGINPNVKLLPIKVGVGSGAPTTSAIVNGINFAVNNRVKVINASLGGPGFDQETYDAINNAKNSNVLLVAAAGNDGTDNTATHQYPSDFELPNIISVAAIDQNDTLATFSNYGSTIVHIAAPGVNIYSTSIFSFDNNFDLETVSQLPSGWKQTGTNASWVVDDEYFFSAPYSLSDSRSIEYKNNTDSIIYYDELIRYRNDPVDTLTFSLYTEFGDGIDSLDVVYSTDKETWTTVVNYTGAGAGAHNGTKTVDLSTQFKTHKNLYLGFRLKTNDNTTGFGVIIDNVKFQGGTNGYKFLNGTSMAAPHVAGLASLIWSYAPTLTYQQVKDIILNSVEKKASLTGKVSTGGRINAYNALKLTPGISVEKGNTDVRAGDQGYVEPEAGKRASIRFRPSTSGKVEVNIYTLSGALVFTTSVESSGSAQQTVTWDGRTNAGELVASGVYLIHIKGPGIDEKKKIAVIK